MNDYTGALFVNSRNHSAKSSGVTAATQRYPSRTIETSKSEYDGDAICRHARDPRKKLETVEKYRTLYELAPVGYLTLDEHGIIVDANAVGARMLWGEDPKARRRAFAQFLARSDRERFLKFFDQAKKCDSPITCDVELKRRRTSGRRVIRLDANPVCRKDNGECRVGVIASEVTKQRGALEQLSILTQTLEHRVEARTAEAEERANQLHALAYELVRTEYRERRRIAEVLHETLAQLLSAAIIKIEASRNSMGLYEGTSEEVRDLLSILKEATKQTRGLMSDLNPLVLQQEGLQAALESLLLDVRKIGLTVHIGGDEIPQLREEVALVLFSSVRELLFNVVKHAHTDEAWVHSRVSEGKLHLAVQDKGVGTNSVPIRPRSLTADGLGLPSIRDRVRGLGGHFDFETVRNLGTQCTISVPLFSTNHALPIGTVASAETSGHVVEQPVLKFMVVNNHRDVREVIREQLSQMEFVECVGVVKNGRDALRRGMELVPDVVILGINLPRMNGIEATRRLKHALPGITILGICMGEDDETQSEMLAAGAFRVIQLSQLPVALVDAIDALRFSYA